VSTPSRPRGAVSRWFGPSLVRWLNAARSPPPPTPDVVVVVVAAPGRYDVVLEQAMTCACVQEGCPNCVKVRGRDASERRVDRRTEQKEMSSSSAPHVAPATLSRRLFVSRSAASERHRPDIWRGRCAHRTPPTRSDATADDTCRLLSSSGRGHTPRVLVAARVPVVAPARRAPPRRRTTADQVCCEALSYVQLLVQFSLGVLFLLMGAGCLIVFRKGYKEDNDEIDDDEIMITHADNRGTLTQDLITTVQELFIGKARSGGAWDG